MACPGGTTPAGSQIIALTFSGGASGTITPPSLITSYWDASTVKAYVMPGSQIKQSGTIGGASFSRNIGSEGGCKTEIKVKTEVASGVGSIGVTATSATICDDGSNNCENYQISGSYSTASSPGTVFNFGSASSLKGALGKTTLVVDGAAKNVSVPSRGCAGSPCGADTNCLIAGLPADTTEIYNVSFSSGITGVTPPAAYSITIQWEGTACNPPPEAPPPPPPPTGEPPTASPPPTNPPPANTNNTPPPPPPPDNPPPGNPPSPPGCSSCNPAPPAPGGFSSPSIPSNSSGSITFAPPILTGCTSCLTCPTLCTPVFPTVTTNLPPIFVFLPDGTFQLVAWNGYVTYSIQTGFSSFGVPYPTLYNSPLLASGMFNTRKRLKHAYLQFDNELGMASYSALTTSVDNLYGKASVQLDSNIYISYFNEAGGEPITDTYRYDSIRFPSPLYTSYYSTKQIDERYTLFKEPLLGTSYGYQLGVYSLDAATWRLVGWQVTAKMKGETVGEFNE